MNLVYRQIYGTKKGATANTFIGGVASTISTPALLATKLGIDVSRITNFSIVGSDIQCRITGSYDMPFSCWYNDSFITYFKDNDGLVSKLNGQSFSTNSNLEFLSFPNCITAIGGSSSWLFYTSPKVKHVYMPRCSNFGGTTGNDSCTFGIPIDAKIYLPISLQTNNGGLPDGDMAILGTKITYVSNFIAPSTITDLSAGIIYNKSIKLNFTTPSSTNAIDYYEVYRNGVFYQNISESEYITLLNPLTSYSFQLIVVDIFYNKSLASNTLLSSTNSTVFSDYSAMAYYRFNRNVNDQINGYNAKSYNVTYGVGKTNKCIIFNGASYVTELPIIPYEDFSVSFWFKSTTTSSGVLFSQRNTGSGNQIIEISFFSNKVYSRLRGTGGGGLITLNSTTNLNDGNWHHFVMTFNKTTGTQKNYVDGTLNGTATYTGGTFASFNRGAMGVDAYNLSSGLYTGSLDSVGVFLTELNSTEVTNIYNAGNSGNEIV
jgi:hypothetical protein